MFLRAGRVWSRWPARGVVCHGLPSKPVGTLMEQPAKQPCWNPLERCLQLTG